MSELEKNNTYTSEITGYTSDGSGVCRIDGRAVFVKGALRGETWKIRIVKSSASAVYARAEECLSPSAERSAPPCPLFGKCGGCDLMHMSYAEELRMKLDRVNGAFAHIAGLDLRADAIIPSDRTEGYRNKAVYNIGELAGRPVFGFYRSGTHEIVPLRRCLLQTETADRCAFAVCEWMEKYGIRAYDEKTGGGAVRHVFTRTAGDGSAVCCVVSAEGFGKNTGALVGALREACPALTGIVLNINKTAGNTVLGGDFYTIWGDGDLTDTLCGFTFRISPQSFYQINPPQAEKLYAVAASYAAPEGTGTVLDLYCGAGTISLCLARTAEKVIGAEIVPEAVRNAEANAARNKVGNVEFICADAGSAAAELKRRGAKPEAVVVDPPRRGMSAEAVDAVCSMGPARVVYVSCDPATLARDLKRFAQLGYRAVSATAVDMFPHTGHVECVVLMSRVKD